MSGKITEVIFLQFWKPYDLTFVTVYCLPFSESVSFIGAQDKYKVNVNDVYNGAVIKVYLPKFLHNIHIEDLDNY